MLNIPKSKNTVLISNISIITFLNFAFYIQAASLLVSRGLEARGRTSRGEAMTHEVEAEAMTHEAEAKTHEARFFGAEARPRGLTSLTSSTTGHS